MMVVTMPPAEADEHIARAAAAERAVALCEQRERSAAAAAALAEEELLRVLKQTESERTKCRELQQQVHDAERQAAEVVERGMERRLQINSKFDSDLVRLEAQAAAMDAETEATSQDNHALEEKLRAFEASHGAHAERDAAEARAAELEAKLYRAQIAEAEARLRVLHQEAPSKREAIFLLDATVAARNKQLALYEGKLDELEEMLESSRELTDSMRKQITEYDERSSGLENEAKRLADEARAVRMKADTIQKRARELQNIASQASDQREAIAADIRQLHGRRMNPSASHACR